LTGRKEAGKDGQISRLGKGAKEAMESGN